VITGIICEYNPLHLGHKKQLDMIRKADPEGSIVCLMSGNYVQRGKPAIVDKSLRAEAAIHAGADLVLEMPVGGSLSSAEGFANEGVRILGKLCHTLCFGAETAEKESIFTTAKALLSSEFSEILVRYMDEGQSYPAACQAALEGLNVSGELLRRPNDILAVEYCKAILKQNAPLDIFPICRQGDYHDTAPDRENPSATAVRELMLLGGPWQDYVPAQEPDVLHTLEQGEKAILARLRTMTDEEFESLPHGSEGLWRKLMHNARKGSSLAEILDAVKSKRYPRTRIDRMVMCAFLGLTAEHIKTPAPYVRVLAFNDKGRQILKDSKDKVTLVNAGEVVADPYQELETRCGRLYGLFAEQPEPADPEKDRRVRYIQSE
jgi:predicted nucleotidyltransferase